MSYTQPMRMDTQIYLIQYALKLKIDIKNGFLVILQRNKLINNFSSTRSYLGHERVKIV